MTELRIPRPIGVALLALLTMIVSFVVVAPAEAAGNPYSEYRFTFANGQVLTGSTQGGKGFEAPVFDTGYTIHVSCSAVFDDGWSSNQGAFPTQGVHDAGWEILSYKIDRYKGDGSYHFTCGETFTPSSITVKKNASPASEAFDFDLNGEIPAPPGGSSSTYDGATASVLGDNVDSYTWSDLDAGNYTLSELMSDAQRSAGWQFTGVTCDSGFWTAGDESVAISLRGGQDITCTFSDVLDAEPQPVTVSVVSGTCVWDGASSNTTVTITIDPALGATVTLTGPGVDIDFTSSDTIVVGPGEYSWSAVAAGDHELSGPSSGGFTAIDCEPEPEPVTVSVVSGTCVWDGESSNTTVTITIDPALGATVTLTGPGVDIDFTSSDTIVVGPGEYSWSAVAAGDHELSGPSSGEFTTLDCEEPLPTVTVTVVAGSCSWDGEASVTTVTFTVTEPGGATVELTGDGVAHTFTTSGETFDVGPGDYSWAASANEGFVLEGATAGAFTAEDCPPPGAIGDTVWHDIDGDGLQGADEPGIPDVTVTLLVDGATVATQNTDTNGNYLFENLPPGDYDVVFTIPDGWIATTADAGDDTLDSDAADDGTTPTVTLGAGEEDLDTDLGLLLPATIVVEKVTEPVADGTFGFTGDITADLGHGESASSEVVPGTYTVTETVPDGWALVDVSCTAGGSGDVASATATYEVASGDTVTCTFTNTNEGTVVLEKATDVDTDEVFSFTIGDATVELGSGDSVELSLPSGEYTITEDVLLVDGWELADIVCSGEATTSVDTATATLFVPPAATVGCTFVNTEVEAPLGVIGDLVWNDIDGDGVQDASEPGIAGATVELLDASGSVLLSTTTNAAGIYVIANVPAGDYVAQFTVPEPWLFTGGDLGGDDTRDSDVIDIVGTTGAIGALQSGPAVGKTAMFTMGEGEINLTIDAGVFQTTVLPTPPVTPDTPTPPTTPDTPTPPEDTKVLAAQTELPNTGLDNQTLAIIALALIAGGWLLVNSIAREDEDLIATDWSGRI